MKFIKRALGTIFFLFVGLVILGTIGGHSDSRNNMAATQKLTDQERAARIAGLDAKVQSIPASELEENLRLYRELQTLDPTNTRYKQKVAYYQDKIDNIRDMARHPERYVKVKDFSWRKEAFGNVMEVDFTIENMLPVNVKDIEIKCTHSAPSGTVIDSNTRTIYEVIGAGKTRVFRNFNMGFIHAQAYRSSCQVVNVTRLN
jgi:hypothetical protein